MTHKQRTNEIQIRTYYGLVFNQGYYVRKFDFSKYLQQVSFHGFSEIEALTMKCSILDQFIKKHIMLKKKQFFKLLVFLSGIGILTWQVWNTFEAFIDGQTTFAVSKETMERMTPSTMIFCPMNDFENGLNTQNNINVSDREEFFKQFFRLDDGLNITMTRWIYNAKSGRFEYVMSNLTIGENFDYDSKSKTFLVEELFNKLFGLCYALTPDESFKMSMKDSVLFNLHYKQGTEIPPTDVILLSQEDLYSFLFFDLGQASATGYIIHLKAGTTIGVHRKLSGVILIFF